MINFKLFCTFLVIILSLNSCLSSGVNIDNPSEKFNSNSNSSIKNDTNFIDSEAIKMLLAFYNEYIRLVANTIDNREIESLRKKYCTPSLLIKIRNQDLNYDPFIRAQDANEKWLNSLIVKKKEGRIYEVKYIETYSNNPVFIILKIDKIGSNYRIMDIK